MTTAMNFPIEDASSRERASPEPESSAESPSELSRAHRVQVIPTLGLSHTREGKREGKSAYSLDFDAWHFQSAMKWK